MQLLLLLQSETMLWQIDDVEMYVMLMVISEITGISNLSLIRFHTYVLLHPKVRCLTK